MEPAPRPGHVQAVRGIHGALAPAGQNDQTFLHFRTANELRFWLLVGGAVLRVRRKFLDLRGALRAPPCAIASAGAGPSAPVRRLAHSASLLTLHTLPWPVPAQTEATEPGKECKSMREDYFECVHATRTVRLSLSVPPGDCARASAYWCRYFRGQQLRAHFYAA